MNMENESSKSDVQCVQSVQSIGTECGPSGADVSCAKPDNNVASSHLVSNVSVMTCAKPTGDCSVWLVVWGIRRCGGSRKMGSMVGKWLWWIKEHLQISTHRISTHNQTQLRS